MAVTFPLLSRGLTVPHACFFLFFCVIPIVQKTYTNGDKTNTLGDAYTYKRTKRTPPAS